MNFIDPLFGKRPQGVFSTRLLWESNPGRCVSMAGALTAKLGVALCLCNLHSLKENTICV